MIKTSKKLFITLLTVILTVSFILSSCQSGDNNNSDTSEETTTQGDIQDEEAQSVDNRDIPDNLPEKDMGGRDFNILCHEMLTVEFVAEEEIGEIVNDALHLRNLAVAERFNANINMIQIPGSWADRDSYMNTIRNSVFAGESTYDLVAGVTSELFRINLIVFYLNLHSNYVDSNLQIVNLFLNSSSFIPNLIPQGIFMNINNIEHLNFSQPWWGEELVKELSIGDKLYLVTGDIALSMWDCIFVFYFNKQIVQDNSLPNLYSLVKNKEWTYDKFAELSKAVSTDVNGDGKYDKEDMFGFVTTTGTVANAFSGAFDLKITQKDANNIPYPNLDVEKWSAAITKLVDLHYNTQSTLTLPDGSDQNTIVPMFQENRALFFPQTLSFSRDFRAMETDFGILPFPLYDSNQANYYSAVRNAMSMIGVPTTVSNSEDCGIIMEALAAESYKKVIPAYYDVSLKVKNTRDDESGEMLDIIRDNLWMNFGYSYSLSTGSIGNYIREAIESKRDNFASAYESTFSARAAIFDKFIEDVLNLS